MARRREETAGTREARTAETDAVVVGRKHACLAGDVRGGGKARGGDDASLDA